MKLVIVSTFWNSEKYVADCINSIKNQYYGEFVVYMVDDMSTDNSYNVALETINGDERFILIKNTKKKYKTKNFIDVINNNPNIDWDDVIVEIDGDDNFVDLYQRGNGGQKWADIVLTGDGHTVDVDQRGSQSANATVDLTNSGGAYTLDLDQNVTTSADSYSITGICSTFGGCSVTVNRNN